GKDTRRDAVFLRQGWLDIRGAWTDRWRGVVEAAALVRAAIAERGGVDAGGAEDRLRNWPFWGGSGRPEGSGEQRIPEGRR
ncbi:hypothetical protein R0J90_22110, partial [Micrococcus sp. SIMBA_144]